MELLVILLVVLLLAILLLAAVVQHAAVRHRATQHEQQRHAMERIVAEAEREMQEVSDYYRRQMLEYVAKRGESPWPSQRPR